MRRVGMGDGWCGVVDGGWGCCKGFTGWVVGGLFWCWGRIEIGCGIERDSRLVISATSKLGKDALAEFKKRLGIQSPSKVMMGLGKFMDEGLGIGIISNVKAAMLPITNMANAMIAGRLNYYSHLCGYPRSG
jgi:hypothetical protein